MTTETGKRQVLVDAVLDFGSMATLVSNSLTVAVPQARLGQAVHVTPPLEAVAPVAAQGTLTMATQPTDGDTITIDSKVYTWEDTLTNVDGNIYTGADAAGAQANLVAALDLSGTAGVDYAAAMTAHPTVDIAAFAANDAVLTAKTAGIAGNSIATTETFTDGSDSFDAATLGTTTAGFDAPGIVFQAFVSAADVVTVVATNASGATFNAASGTYRVIVWF